MKQILAATSNMLARIRELEITANNISNVNTPGYKRDLYFANILQNAEQNQSRLSSESNSIHLIERNVVDLAQGSLQKTDNPLDLAINGKGFFVLENREGNEIYTRNGSFQINDEGFLVTNVGHYVMGTGGKISVQGAEIRISGSGNITIDGELIDQLQLVVPTKERSLKKTGGSTYSFEVQEAEQPGTIEQGFLEQSNVNPIESMVKLVALQRDFDSNQKMVQSFDDINKVAANDLGRIPR